MRTTVISALTVALVTGVIGAGASMLVLTGSDTAPGSGKTEAACAGPLVIEHPVTQISHDNDAVEQVTVTGDMTACEDQTMLVEIDLDAVDTNHAYAVLQVPADATSAAFDFDATTGDFYDTKPTVAGGTLIPAGDRLDPVKAADFGLVTVTIATQWE